MRLLLISPNTEFLPDPVFPIGLAYIAAALELNQIEHRIVDLCFVENYEKEIIDNITIFQPDLVGLSLRNLDNVSFPEYTSYLPFYREIVDMIRKHTKARVILGGSAFSIMPEEILAYLDGDFGIAGEGERALIELVRQIEAADHTGVPLKRGVVRDFQVGMIKNLDELPCPDRSGLDGDAYLRFGGMGNVQTKRGCPFQCIYCTYPIIEGKKVRLRSPKKICDEIEGLVQQGIKYLFMVDNEFNFPVEHAKFVCHEIIRRKLKIQWSGYANPEFMTTGLAEVMKESGCTGIEFGSDAANPVMLRNMGKTFTVGDLHRASEICRQVGISFCHSLLIGGPGETMATVRETFDAVLEMGPTAVIGMVGIRIFPNTRLAKMAASEGRVSPDTDFLKPVFYLAPAIEKEILPFVEQFSKEHASWIFPGMNININTDLQKKIRRFGVKGPLWEYMRMGQRFLA